MNKYLDNLLPTTYVQVNLFQKYLFLHQLTHNMTKDCPLNYQFNTWKFQAQNTVRTCCAHKLFWMSKQKQKPIFVVILWVSWCKNKSFWHRFTCTSNLLSSRLQLHEHTKIFWRRMWITNTLVISRGIWNIFHQNYLNRRFDPTVQANLLSKREEVFKTAAKISQIV